jgi:hypothetical protein
MTKEYKTYSTCLVCRGELIYHDARQTSEVLWAHSDKPLEETAGHTAVPDPARTEVVEVAHAADTL